MIAGAILSSLILLSIASYTYFTTTFIRFFYQEFSLLVHPSYISMYINMCLAWLLLKIINKEFKEAGYSNSIAVIIITFLSFINVLLSSKIGLLTMIFVFIGFLIYYIIKKRKYLFGMIGMLTIAAVIFSALRLLPEMAGRVNRSIAAFSHPSTNPSDTESTAVRFFIWKAANQVIAENFLLGVGTGDAKDALMLEYEKRGMTGAIEHKLNSHNEFYQVFVSLGLIGFIFLILSLFLPLFFAYKTNNVIYILFLIIIIFNFFPESMLETQAGVVFYAFFNSILCFNSSNNQQPTTNNQQSTTNNQNDPIFTTTY
ncbi:MAG: hypothetical protein A3K10_02625 [Bacteroidetes bacterium RIFCSPLOWO2_12_FULL_31_6]|nr:MAG: hypothetical protein A3K10_02625 [Bacteroidetes bacterium RIFCSPLOWO2_12_FULL_31_6]